MSSNSSSKIILSIFILLLFSCAIALPGLRGAPPQQASDPFQDRRNQGQLPSTNPPPDADDQIVKMQKAMDRKVNHDRQVKLKTDADKLFKLATELKDQVDQSSEDVLSVDVVKKAEEIEKLAHSVKEKMKGNS